MSSDPLLAFWLAFAEARGAAVEDGPEQALVVLPPALQREFTLPEATAFTADPDVAAEEGAILLGPGHPLIERAAAAVLEEGDRGLLWLPWPRSVAPTGEALLAQARERVPVDHGRIDAAGEPAAVYVPVLRAEALCTYTLDEQFQERAEAWVDARSGLGIAPDFVRRLRTAAALAGAEVGRSGTHPVLRPQAAAALAGVDGLLEAQAVARGLALARQAQVGLRAEVARTEAYYAEVLESITRRRPAAAPERQALLDRQAAVTAAERARRLEEIAEKFRARHERKTFRLHLLLVPALHLPVWVRRGEARLPMALCWCLPVGAFLPVGCPRCGTVAPLVAGREALGCAVCLPARAGAGGGAGTGAAGRASGAGGQDGGQTPAAGGGPTGAARAGSGEPAAGGPAGAAATAAAARDGGGPAVARTGGAAAEALAAAPGGGAAGRSGVGAGDGAGSSARPTAGAGAAGAGPASGVPQAPRQGTGEVPGAAAVWAAKHEVAASGGAAVTAGAGRSDAARRPGGSARTPGPAALPGAGGRTRTRPAVPLGRSGRVEDPDRAHHEAVFGFWRALAQQGSPPAGVVASPSPLATLLRLYGPSGPLRAVGVAAGGRPEEASVHLSLPDPFLPRAAAGAIRVGGTEYPYTLRWAAGAVGAKVAFAEVLPCADVYGVVLPPRSQLAASIAARLYERAPAPRANLDPIAQAVWDLVRPGWGLPLVARCLTALWRLPGGNPLASERPAVAAAALLWLVGRISGARIAQVRLAKDFGAEAAALKRAAAELGDALGMSIGQPW